MKPTIAAGAKSKFGMQRIVLLLFLVLIFLIFTILNGNFIGGANLMYILRQSSFVLMTGCAVTLLMIAGYLDLSVGSTVALTGVVFAFFSKGGIMPTGIAALIAVAVGLIIGFFNAVMVVKLKLTPFIATLGTMYIGRGLSFLITNGLVIRDDLPENFTFLGQSDIGLIPLSLVILAVLVFIFVFLEKKSFLGKYSVALGGNKTAAMLSGINADFVAMLLYSIVGLIAGFTGIMMASRLGVGDPNIGVGFEFDVIIAVILGGTSLAGGEGSIIGMVIGGITIGGLGQGLKLLNVFTFFQSIVKGVVLVVAVLLDQRLKSGFRQKSGVPNQKK